jgi:hypothetical protein
MWVEHIAEIALDKSLGDTLDRYGLDPLTSFAPRLEKSGAKLRCTVAFGGDGAFDVFTSILIRGAVKILGCCCS